MNNPINIDETDKFIRDKLCIELAEFYNEPYFTYVDNEIGIEIDELYHELYDSFGMPLNYSSK